MEDDPGAEVDEGVYRDFSGAVGFGPPGQWWRVIFRRPIVYKVKWHRVGSVVKPYCPDPYCPSAGALLAGEKGADLHTRYHQYAETGDDSEDGAFTYETAGAGSDDSRED